VIYANAEDRGGRILYNGPLVSELKTLGGRRELEHVNMISSASKVVDVV